MIQNQLQLPQSLKRYAMISCLTIDQIEIGRLYQTNDILYPFVFLLAKIDNDVACRFIHKTGVVDWTYNGPYEELENHKFILQTDFELQYDNQDNKHFIEVNNNKIILEYLCDSIFELDGVICNATPYGFQDSLSIGFNRRAPFDIELSKDNESLTGILRKVKELVGEENFIFFRRVVQEDKGAVPTVVGFDLFFKDKHTANLVKLCLIKT